LLDAKEVIVSGFSAGGLATLINIEYIKSKLNPNTKLIGNNGGG